jgi:Flp pilus assembly protein TadG
MAATTDFSPNPNSGARGRRPGMRCITALRRHQGGATAVEFALVAPPFFGLLFAILETALMFWTTQVLETAVANASRAIYTGQFQSANPGAGTEVATKFKTELCKNVIMFVTCDSPAVHVDVRPYRPGDVLPQPITDGSVNAAGFTYQATRPGDIVLVRVAIEYPVLVPTLSALEANLGNGKRLVMATATFRNEPF